MLTINIEERGKKPIYEYIYCRIRDDILSGMLVSGDKLPSKRELASSNGVSLITVENAYEQLVIEGYIEARERRGFYVADIDISEGKNIARPIEKKESVLETKREDETQMVLADFVKGSVQADAFPYSVWAKLLRRIIAEREKNFIEAPDAKGVLELRKVLSAYLWRTKNLNVDPECIVIGPGTEYLHSVLLQLIGRNRIVAVEDPGYKKAEKIYESNGLKVMHIPVDGEGICVDKLSESNVKVVHVSPSHHFPTGIIMSAARRHKLISWALEHSAYIIEDDYDSEFRYKGRPLPTLMSLSGDAVIYMNTFTSSISPSIRIAYMVLPRALMNIYEDKLSYISGAVSTFEQLTLSAFIEEGYYERHIARMRNRCRQLKSQYEEILESTGLNIFAAIKDDKAGLNCILEIDTIDDDATFIDQLRKRGIYLRAMTDYCYNTHKEYEHKFILRYADISKEDTVASFTQILDVVKTNLQNN